MIEPAPTSIPQPEALRELFGDIDVYLFDQLMKGRVTARDRLLDAGCGGGRNLVYLLRCGAPVSGIDQSSGAVQEVRRLAAALSPTPPGETELEERFQVAAVEEIPFPDAHFDVVVSNAVLHFARGADHFRAMVREMGRVLAPGGLFFCRLGTTISFEALIEPVQSGDGGGLGGGEGGGRYRLPEGSERFLATEAQLREETDRLGTLLEPVKTTRVETLRTMTTWVVRKSGRRSAPQAGR